MHASMRKASRRRTPEAFHDIGLLLFLSFSEKTPHMQAMRVTNVATPLLGGEAFGRVVIPVRGTLVLRGELKRKVGKGEGG